MTNKENQIKITDPFQGKEHINYALVETTRPMMYKALKYLGQETA